jgi:FK506-binding protein 1
MLWSYCGLVDLVSFVVSGYLFVFRRRFCFFFSRCFGFSDVCLRMMFVPCFVFEFRLTPTFFFLFVLGLGLICVVGGKASFASKAESPKLNELSPYQFIIAASLRNKDGLSSMPCSINISKKMGVQKTIIKPGSGRTPKQGELVQAHYVGRFMDGKEFDSSRTRNKPLTYMIGIGSVIKGWDEGIMDMQLGEIAKLHVTSDYGYGLEGMPPIIPPNTDLEFEVELLAAGDDKADAGGCISM